MEDVLYLPPFKGGRWSIGRRVGNNTVCLIQDSYMDDPEDVYRVLQACDISPTAGNIDFYFPVRWGKGRCPTLAILEKFARPSGRLNTFEVGV
jgi:hypothetical protein